MKPTPSTRIVTRQARITGRVQGVSYRAWTRGQAEHLGLDGWVMNRDDGCVIAVFHGPENKVEEMLTACWTGPGAANVRDVQSTPAEAPDGAGFHIKH